MNEGNIVNKEIHVKILYCLGDAMRKKRPGKWAQYRWFLLHDNAPAHRALVVKTYLAKHNVMALEHPLYSVDLSPSDFILFQQLKCSARTICKHRCNHCESDKSTDWGTGVSSF
jgi:hypothetical protein